MNGSKNSFSKNALFCFDLIVIVVNDVIGEDSIRFASFCTELGRRVCFVRSKCDVALRSMQDDGYIKTCDQSSAKEFVKQRKNRNHILLTIISHESI
jgi:hypothetical protein